MHAAPPPMLYFPTPHAVDVHVKVKPVPRVLPSVPATRNASPVVLVKGPLVPKFPAILLAPVNATDGYAAVAPLNNHTKSQHDSVLKLR